MSKLISNPTECGYRLQQQKGGFKSNQPICSHLETYGNKCNEPSVFPTNCPLPDGITVEQCRLRTKMADEIAKSEKPIVFKPKRRNRKDCVHNETPDVFGRLTCLRPWGTDDCIGVNCGFFKTK